MQTLINGVKKPKDGDTSNIWSDGDVVLGTQIADAPKNVTVNIFIKIN